MKRVKPRKSKTRRAYVIGFGIVPYLAWGPPVTAVSEETDTEESYIHTFRSLREAKADARKNFANVYALVRVKRPRKRSEVEKKKRRKV